MNVRLWISTFQGVSLARKCLPRKLLMVVDLKDPDCGFNHSSAMVGFNYKKIKTLWPRGRSCFLRDSPSSWVMQRGKKPKMELSGNKKLKINAAAPLAGGRRDRSDTWVQHQGARIIWGKQKRRGFERQKRASNKIWTLQISRVFRKTEVSLISLSREQSICNYHHKAMRRVKGEGVLVHLCL